MNGKDADPELMRSQIIRAVAAMPTPQDGAPGRDGTDGADGLGFDEMDCCFDEARGWLLRFTRGDLVREFELGVPFDAGEVWTAGKRYPKGAGVRRDGSWWIAQQPNLNIQPGAGTPQSSKAWKLAAKRGQDGNPGKDGKNGGDL